MRTALVMAALLLLATCADRNEVPPDLAPPAENLVWPQPPAPARVKYLFTFGKPEDLGFTRSIFGRLWSLVAGEDSREMIRPYAIAVDGDVVAIADPGAHVVHLYDLRQREYRRIEAAGEDALVSPVGIAFGNDRLFVADSVLERVFVFDRSGKLALTIEGLSRPTGLAFDPVAKRLYVADTLAHKVDVFDTDGAKLFSFGRRGIGEGEFNYPTHVSIWGNRLYVNDTMNFRVQSFMLDGSPLASFGSHGDGSGDLAQPKGVAVDAAGHIYVADTLFNRVQIFDPNGVFLLAFGGEGIGAGLFWLPAGVFIAENRIFVADSYNRRIQVFEYLGEV